MVGADARPKQHQLVQDLDERRVDLRVHRRRRRRLHPHPELRVEAVAAGARVPPEAQFYIEIEIPFAIALRASLSQSLHVMSYADRCRA